LRTFHKDLQRFALGSSCRSSRIFKDPTKIFTRDKRLGGELLKKGNVFNHNLILIPCNEVGNNHRFLLCVYPKVQHVMVLDSAAGKFIKPTHQRSITKMWRALVVAHGKPNP